MIPEIEFKSFRIFMNSQKNLGKKKDLSKDKI